MSGTYAISIALHYTFLNFFRRVAASSNNVGELIAGHALSTADFYGYGTSYTGLMTWWGANAWADQLVYGGFDDWRLPSALNQDGSGPNSGCNITGSEMGHLYYTASSDGLGNSAGGPLSNTGPFTNLQPYYYEPIFIHDSYACRPFTSSSTSRTTS